LHGSIEARTQGQCLGLDYHAEWGVMSEMQRFFVARHVEFEAVVSCSVLLLSSENFLFNSRNLIEQTAAADRASATVPVQQHPQVSSIH
jgi:hypothetical protein